MNRCSDERMKDMDNVPELERENGQETVNRALVTELGFTETQLPYITYDGTGDAITALLGGQWGKFARSALVVLYCITLFPALIKLLQRWTAKPQAE